jgi:hypothetical protein
MSNSGVPCFRASSFSRRLFAQGVTFKSLELRGNNTRPV